MWKQGATFQLGEKHITWKYSLHFLFFLHHLQLFIKLWPKKQSCWTKLRKKRGCQAPLTPSMQDTGLLMIHGKRTIILPAASHVINQLHRQLAAFSRSSTRKSHSHTEFSVTSPHWKRDIRNSDLDPLALRKHDWGGSALLDGQAGLGAGLTRKTAAPWQQQAASPGTTIPHRLPLTTYSGKWLTGLSSRKPPKYYFPTKTHPKKMFHGISLLCMIAVNLSMDGGAESSVQLEWEFLVRSNIYKRDAAAGLTKSWLCSWYWLPSFESWD